jgi:quercetin dioxygenase-like cupin family protein
MQVMGSKRMQMVATGFAAAAVLLLGSASAAEDAPRFVRITPSEVHWTDIPGGMGAKYAVVLGDPSKPGLYVVRAIFPPHVMDTPHIHPNDRYVTVLSGVWYTGTGPKLEISKAVPLGPGSVMFHPGGAVHWDGSAGDAPVMVQITGMGPAPTLPIEPKAGAWVKVEPAK